MEKEENKKLPSTKKLDVIKKTTVKKKSEKIEEDIDTNIIVEKTVSIKQNITIQPTVKTLKEIFEQYIIDGNPYRIYLKGNIIFDSAKHTTNPLFYDDYFILFGNKYIYKGIRFEKY